jgi:hypothetical protein
MIRGAALTPEVVAAEFGPQNELTFGRNKDIDLGGWFDAGNIIVPERSPISVTVYTP